MQYFKYYIKIISNILNKNDSSSNVYIFFLSLQLFPDPFETLISLHKEQSQ